MRTLEELSQRGGGSFPSRYPSRSRSLSRSHPSLFPAMRAYPDEPTYAQGPSASSSSASSPSPPSSTQKHIPRFIRRRKVDHSVERKHSSGASISSERHQASFPLYPLNFPAHNRIAPPDVAKDVLLEDHVRFSDPVETARYSPSLPALPSTSWRAFESRSSPPVSYAPLQPPVRATLHPHTPRTSQFEAPLDRYPREENYPVGYLGANVPLSEKNSSDFTRRNDLTLPEQRSSEFVYSVEDPLDSQPSTIASHSNSLFSCCGRRISLISRRLETSNHSFIDLKIARRAFENHSVVIELIHETHSKSMSHEFEPKMDRYFYVSSGSSRFVAYPDVGPPLKWVWRKSGKEAFSHLLVEAFVEQLNRVLPSITKDTTDRMWYVDNCRERKV